MNHKMAESMVYDVRDVLTFRELMESSVRLFHDACAFIFHEGDGVREVSYAQAYEDIRALATYLQSRGLSGKHIAVMGKNGYRWAISYLAIGCGVGVIVPIDRELQSDELQYVVEHSDTDAILYTPDVAQKVEALGAGPLLLNLADMDAYIEQGRALLAAGDTSYDSYRIDPHALGILLYTSGTTGLAKGVMLSQYNICYDLVHVLRRVKVQPGERMLSILPLHHTYECTAGFLGPLYAGASIAYNDSLRHLQSDFKLFQPTILCAVPLVLESLRNTILKKYAKIRGGNTLLAVQRRAADMVHRAESPWSRKIFATVQEALGGKLRMVLSGAALLPPEVFSDFERFGIKIYIGYGLTETSPVSLMHNDFYRCADDIGYPLNGCEARLSDVDENGVGELTVRGAQVMLGYYKNPEETAKVLRDGWFYTGDLAIRKPNGAYKITGRQKSMIVTQNGKKIFPEELEYYLLAEKLIAEAMVYGEDGERDVVVTAAVYPDYAAVNELLFDEGIMPDSEGYSRRVQELMAEAVKRVNEKLPHFRHITRIVVRRTEFVKTSTRKIKRGDANNRTEGDV